MDKDKAIRAAKLTAKGMNKKRTGFNQGGVENMRIIGNSLYRADPDGKLIFQRTMDSQPQTSVDAQTPPPVPVSGYFDPPPPKREPYFGESMVGMASPYLENAYNLASTANTMTPDQESYIPVPVQRMNNALGNYGMAALNAVGSIPYGAAGLFGDVANAVGVPRADVLTRDLGAMLDSSGIMPEGRMLASLYNPVMSRGAEAIDAAQRAQYNRFMDANTPSQNLEAFKGRQLYEPTHNEAALMQYNPMTPEQIAYWQSLADSDKLLQRGASAQDAADITGILRIPRVSMEGDILGTPREPRMVTPDEMAALRPDRANNYGIPVRNDVRPDQGTNLAFFDDRPGQQEIWVNPLSSPEHQAMARDHEMIHADQWRSRVPSEERGTNVEDAADYRLKSLNSLAKRISAESDPVEKSRLSEQFRNLRGSSSDELYSRNPGELYADAAINNWMTKRLTPLESLNPYLNKNKGLMNRALDATAQAALGETTPWMSYLERKGFRGFSDRGVHTPVPPDISKAVIGMPPVAKNAGGAVGYSTGGALELARAVVAKNRAGGQIAPSKYLPNVPRAVHADGGEVEDAINALPHVGQNRNGVPPEEAVASPLPRMEYPYMSMTPARSVHTYPLRVAINKAHAEAKVEDVPMDKIVTDVGAIGKSKIRNPSEGFPFVERINGVHHLRDGNHRAAAAFLRGDKSIKVLVADMDEAIKANGRSANERADGGRESGKRDFTRDNPGGEWLEGKQARAAQYPDRKFVAGAITGVIGGRSSMFLPTHILKGIAGMNDETRTAGVHKYDSLLSDAQEGGFDPNQKGNKVVVAVNHYGQPYLLEGNTRVAVAHSLGIPKVKAEVRYWNGAENVDGPMHPDQVFGMASDSPEVAKAEGGRAGYADGGRENGADGIVVYQGRSKKGIKSFFNPSGQSWGTTQIGTANQFAGENESFYPGATPRRMETSYNGEVHRLRFNIKNPMRVSIKDTMWDAGKERDKIEEAKSKGHDGLEIYHNPEKSDFVAFSPNQVEHLDSHTPETRSQNYQTGGRVTDTDEFRNWFGNSVTHTDGEPHVLYTGTSKDRDFTSHNVGRHGAWFVRDPAEASQYAEQNDSQGYKREGFKLTPTNTASRVIPAYVKAENPYTGELPEEYLRDNYKAAQSDWFDTLRAKGHDSWVPASQSGNLVVALKEPQQIKSIFNNGKFDPKEKHMNKAGGGEVDNNVTDLSTVRTKRDITSGDHSYGAQNMFADLADKYAESQKAFDMAHASGAFDNFQMGDMFKYNGLPNYDPEKIVGFTVKHVSSSPNMTKLFNNHYPALEFETQDADRKVTTVPLEWFENNLHKYDKVGGKPRIVKGGGGEIDQQNGEMKNETGPINLTARPQAGELPNAGGIRGGAGVLQTQNEAPLEGLPQKIVIPLTGQIIRASADPRIRQVARDYMAQSGLPYSPPTKYAKVDPKRAARIASDYTAMEDNPNDPLTKASYDAMIKETMDQYRAAKKSGLNIEFWNPRKQEDPYKASPRLATEDIRNNHHMWVFPTYSGYGSGEPIGEDDAKKNPLLQLTGEKWNGIPVTVNDVFRAIHDYYGHAKEGLGFRADGEENAWRAHASMFSPLARMAMTSETRGQNSWLNYGPHGEHNRKARTEDTIFAPQKIGVLSHLSHHEGAEDFIKPEEISLMASIRSRFGRKLGGAVDAALALTRRFTKDGKSAINCPQAQGEMTWMTS